MWARRRAWAAHSGLCSGVLLPTPWHSSREEEGSCSLLQERPALPITDLSATRALKGGVLTAKTGGVGRARTSGSGCRPRVAAGDG